MESALSRKDDAAARCKRLHETAHQRLQQLLDDVTGTRFYGQIAVAVEFRDGAPRSIRHRIDGTDR